MQSNPPPSECVAALETHACASTRHEVDSITPDCLICRQLEDVDARYFDRLMRDTRARRAQVGSIATSMGFCETHREFVTSLGSRASEIVEKLLLEAQEQLRTLFGRTSLQGDLIQDILFGARTRCPACGYFHRIEGKVLARVLGNLEHAKSARHVPALCLFHLHALVNRTEPPLRGRLLRLLRTKARATSEVLRAHSTADPDTRNRAVCRLLYPLGSESKPVRTAMPACPVCKATATARDRWLNAAADSVRLEQPGWIALPTCRRHLLLCIAHPDTRLQDAALSHYLHAMLPASRVSASANATPPQHRRRSKIRWFDTRGSSPRLEASDVRMDEIPKNSPCPGCNAEDIAARQALAALVGKVARVPHEAIRSTTMDLCLKHFAEALIHASSPQTEASFIQALHGSLHPHGVGKAYTRGNNAPRQAMSDKQT
jgi:hypothetical protein